MITDPIKAEDELSAIVDYLIKSEKPHFEELYLEALNKIDISIDDDGAVHTYCTINQINHIYRSVLAVKLYFNLGDD